MPPTPPPLHPRALDRARGCLLGLAVGEALGRPLEALSAEQVRAALAAGPRLASDAGDQAAMAAIVAESLLEHGRLDLRDLSRRLVAWTRGGARDVGRVAARALYLQSQGQPWADAARVAWEEAHPRGATAEALTRGVALPLLPAGDEQTLARDSLAVSALTHFDPRCRWSAAALNLLIARLWQGAGQGLPGAILGLVGERHVYRALEAVPTLTPSQLPARNEALLVLQTAAWSALNEDDFPAAVARALGRGGPTPLLGAAAGALAGARFGARAIPPDWRAALPDAARLEALADRLTVLASPHAAPGLAPERSNGRASGV